MMTHVHMFAFELNLLCSCSAAQRALLGWLQAIYGSRDVFAQFDLGQKLIGPADTAFLQKQARKES